MGLKKCIVLIIIMLGVICWLLNEASNTNRSKSQLQPERSKPGSTDTDKQPKAEIDSKPPKAVPAQLPLLKIGDSFRTKKFDIQIVQNTTMRAVGNYFNLTASEGAIYVAIRFKYKNISTKPIGSFSKPRIKLKAPDSTEYDPDIGATSSYSTQLTLDEKIFSDLNPGITVSGASVFEVSKELFNPATWKMLIKADDNAEVAFQ